MKIFGIIMKVVAALAAVAGLVYVIATYGDKIVAWAKKMLGKFGCLCQCECQCDADCEECPCEADCDECPCECCCGNECEVVCEEEAEEAEAPAEEAAAEEAPAEEADFEKE
jgi:hypothetical protein